MLIASQLAKLDEFLKRNSSDPMVFAASSFALTAMIPLTWIQIKKSIEQLSRKNNNPEIRKKRSLLHEKFHESKVPADLDYIIIGSGMSGLTCAAILARLGRKVIVLEQHHDTVGGGSHMFDIKGFTFDSGLHYTVPWSIPVFALTCLKKPKDCLTFDMMGEEDGTIDKIYFEEEKEEIDGKKTKNSSNFPFEMPFRIRYKEPHLEQIYKVFPHEKSGIDQFMTLSNYGMDFVKYFFLSRLFPKSWQSWFWWFIPSAIKNVANTTAKDLLPSFIQDKRLISLFSSMWIDTGARPDRATIMLTSSVFRGIPMEGGCYPKGGSVEMAKELVTVIESNGGKVLIRADVEKILFDESLQRVVGVHMRGSGGSRGCDIRCRYGVISSTGYYNTMNNLIAEEIANRFGVARSLPSVDQSAGFVMANIGITCPASVIGATNANTWHIPVDKHGDLFPKITQAFEDPMNPDAPLSAFITFPSMKDKAHADPNKTSCQMLFMANFDSFQQFLPKNCNNTADGNEYELYLGTERETGYEQCKELWKKRALEIFLKYYPAAASHIAFVDISTPLSIEYYLRAVHGAAVGMDCPPQRFCDPFIREQLDPITKIPGLTLTGQDTAICGVTLCQMSGVISALRLEGFCAGMKILLQSILLGNK